ncbi:asparagine synthase-related protein [Psychroserpens sp. MEBiC05023]
MTIATTILPHKQEFAKRLQAEHVLNLEAICIYVATGFFMDDDTFWKDIICLLPAHNHVLDANGCLIESEFNFKWHYKPRDITFEMALDEYVELLTRIIKEQVGDSRVILPLSGGLDSRSQALILKNLPNQVQAFSYAFQNGYPEHKLAQQIASACNFDFKSFKIAKGYLWDSIDELSTINACYSEFTHPRQMAVINELRNMEGVFSLGHWGDVFFDRGIPQGKNESDVVPYLLKKMVKPKGLKLAEQLWQVWGLNGDFKTYLICRIESALSEIKIDNLSAKVRAFKTSQWAHRWTTTNLSVFEATHPITMPYYDNRMCEFICTVPEEFLADRRLQIAHLRQDSSLSKITWQAHRPFNLNNYHNNKSPYNLPFRIFNKAKRVTQELIGKPYVQRNWELQFLGNNNAKHLERYLFDDRFLEWIPKAVIKSCYDDFKNGDSVASSHAVSMLLTLSVWKKKYDVVNFNYQ